MIVLGEKILSDKKLETFYDVKYPYREKYIELKDKTSICYIDKGFGTPVIFIHGMGGDLTHFEYNIKYFKDSFRCIALDLPGYGKSDKPDIDYTISYYTEVLKEFLEKLNIKKCILVGNSMGGHISIMFTLENQEAVEKLILVDSAGLTKLAPFLELFIKYGMGSSLVSLPASRFIDKGIKNIFFDTESEHCKKMTNLFSQIFENKEEYSKYIKAVKSNMKTMVVSRVSYRLSELVLPILIVWGKYDIMVPVNYAYKFLNATPNSKLAVIDEAGHVPMLEKHEVFNPILNDFLAGSSKGYAFLENLKEILFR
jgi:pimeloyl-ACP methyl ester carboxylesterase